MQMFTLYLLGRTYIFRGRQCDASSHPLQDELSLGCVCLHCLRSRQLALHEVTLFHSLLIKKKKKTNELRRANKVYNEPWLWASSQVLSFSSFFFLSLSFLVPIPFPRLLKLSMFIEEYANGYRRYLHKAFCFFFRACSVT